MRNKKVLFLTQSAMIAALYVVLTIVLQPLSFGDMQVRIAEALTILPAFTPAAIPGLFLGCLIGNLLGGAILPDVIFGSLATLLGAYVTHTLRKQSKYLAPLPPILSNMLIMPFVLRYAYGLKLPIAYFMLTVGAGELISCGILGLILYTSLQKSQHKIFKR